ncbi:hypothetical protein [Variovorax sp.]|jgi:hypothetical protein|uniref:hypothetical protein n=1 Tax=Variovorax sp. TaxID=1871043 RepID=UPI0037DA5D7C
MSNLFKKHSIEAIEQCVAEALSKLVGADIGVEIRELEIGNGLVGQTAKFDVRASVKPDANALEDWEIPALVKNQPGR